MPAVQGVLNFVRRFVPNLCTVTAPLVALARKGHKTASEFRKVWGVSQDTALARVKELLSSPPDSKSPDFDREEGVVGAFLAQPTKSKASDQEIDTVAYYSQRFKSGRCCAVVLALTHWRPFLFGTKFTVFTDHRALIMYHLYHM